MAESRCDTCDTGMKQGTWDRGCPSAKGPRVTGSRRGEEQMKKSPYLQLSPAVRRLMFHFVSTGFTLAQFILSGFESRY